MVVPDVNPGTPHGRGFAYEWMHGSFIRDATHQQEREKNTTHGWTPDQSSVARRRPVNSRDAMKVRPRVCGRMGLMVLLSVAAWKSSFKAL